MLEERLVLREERSDFGGKFTLRRESDNAIEDECKDLPVFEYSAKELTAFGGTKWDISIKLSSPKLNESGREMESYEGVSLDTKPKARDYAYNLARRQAEIIAKLSGLELVDELYLDGSKDDEENSRTADNRDLDVFNDVIVEITDDEKNESNQETYRYRCTECGEETYSSKQDLKLCPYCDHALSPPVYIPPF